MGGLTFTQQTGVLPRVPAYGLPFSVLDATEVGPHHEPG